MNNRAPRSRIYQTLERDYGWLSAVLAEHYAGDDTNLRVLAAGVLAAHDDDKRGFAYTTGADQALDQAAHDRWTVVSVKDDWATVF